MPDLSETDLLSTWFEPAISFIEEGLIQSGKVLIHCYHGVSRSATILAAYLLKIGLQFKPDNSQKISNTSHVQEVLEFIKSRRPSICPNDGFIAQLNMWYAMGCRLNPLFKPYKIYQLDCIYHQMKNTKMIPSSVKSFFQVNIVGMTNEYSRKLYSLV